MENQTWFCEFFKKKVKCRFASVRFNFFLQNRAHPSENSKFSREDLLFGLKKQKKKNLQWTSKSKKLLADSEIRTRNLLLLNSDNDHTFVLIKELTALQ